MQLRLDEFVSRETEVWEALKTGDVERDRMALTVDFLGVYPTGFSDRDAHCRQLIDGPIVSTYEITDARIVELATDLVLLAYKATWTRAKVEPDGEPEVMYISSIWKQQGRDWKNIFSQDTPAEHSKKS